MNPFKTLYWQKKVTVAIMLLSLLLQVQTVFACQMMDHGGPIKHCCCDDMDTQREVEEDQTNHSFCCDISSELTLKASDIEADDPVTQPSPTFEIPQVKLAFLLVSLLPELTDAHTRTGIVDFHTDPGHPGTATYLSTLRLRI